MYPTMPGAKRMAGRKKVSFDRGRVEFKCEPELAERATIEGARQGLNLSAFIRMVLINYLDQKEAERRIQQKGR